MAKSMAEAVLDVAQQLGKQAKVLEQFGRDVLAYVYPAAEQADAEIDALMALGSPGAIIKQCVAEIADLGFDEYAKSCVMANVSDIVAGKFENINVIGPHVARAMHTGNGRAKRIAIAFTRSLQALPPVDNMRMEIAEPPKVKIPTVMEIAEKAEEGHADPVGEPGVEGEPGEPAPAPAPKKAAGIPGAVPKLSKGKAAAPAATPAPAPATVPATPKATPKATGKLDYSTLADRWDEVTWGGWKRGVKLAATLAALGKSAGIDADAMAFFKKQAKREKWGSIDEGRESQISYVETTIAHMGKLLAPVQAELDDIMAQVKAGK